jgi:hypothetical protein
MKTTPNYTQVPQTEKPMEPFPKPNTIPAGWELSDMLKDTPTSLESAANTDLVKVSESVSCNNH